MSFKVTDHFSSDQHKQLKNMLEGNVSGGAGGEDDLSLNWFDVISRKLMNELGLLIKCCSKVLFPPARSHGAQRVTGKYLQRAFWPLFKIRGVDRCPQSYIMCVSLQNNHKCGKFKKVL